MRDEGFKCDAEGLVHRCCRIRCEIVNGCGLPAACRIADPALVVCQHGHFRPGEVLT